MLTCGILLPERESRDGYVIQLDVKVPSSINERLTNQEGNALSLGDELRGVESRHDRLENFVHDRREDSLVIVQPELSVQRRQLKTIRLVQDTQRDVNRLQICGRVTDCERRVSES